MPPEVGFGHVSKRGTCETLSEEVWWDYKKFDSMMPRAATLKVISNKFAMNFSALIAHTFIIVRLFFSFTIIALDNVQLMTPQHTHYGLRISKFRFFRDVIKEVVGSFW